MAAVASPAASGVSRVLRLPDPVLHRRGKRRPLLRSAELARRSEPCVPVTSQKSLARSTGVSLPALLPVSVKVVVALARTQSANASLLEEFPISPGLRGSRRTEPTGVQLRRSPD